MKMTRTKLAATLFVALLMFAALPSASSASREVWAMGALHKVDVAGQTLMVGQHRLRVTPRSRLLDRGGSPLSLAELVEHEWEDAKFTAFRVGREFYLTKLELTDEEPQ